MDSIINGPSGAGSISPHMGMARVGEVNGKEFRNRISLLNKVANFNIGSEACKIQKFHNDNRSGNREGFDYEFSILSQSKPDKAELSY